MKLMDGGEEGRQDNSMPTSKTRGEKRLRVSDFFLKKKILQKYPFSSKLVRLGKKCMAGFGTALRKSFQ